MKLFKKVIVLLLISFIPLPVFAAKWKEVVPKRYIDVNSYQHLNDTLYPNRYSIWEKYLNDSSKNFKYIEKQTGKKPWYNLTHWGADCSSKTINELDIIYYDLNGEVIYSDSNSLYSGWNSVIPDSLGEFYYKLLCRPKTTH